MTHTRSTRETSRAGSLLDENAGSGLSENQQLFFGYFIFAATSWLIRLSFGIAAGFVLSNGWLVTNVIGVAVLLCIFVLTHMVAALLSFRMIALIPHHLPTIIGISAANRVDMDRFSRDAALIGTAGALKTIRDGVTTPGRDPNRRLPYGEGATGTLASPGAGMDTTLRAATDTPPQQPPRGEA